MFGDYWTASGCLSLSIAGGSKFDHREQEFAPHQNSCIVATVLYNIAVLEFWLINNQQVAAIFIVHRTTLSQARLHLSISVNSSIHYYYPYIYYTVSTKFELFSKYLWMDCDTWGFFLYSSMRINGDKLMLICCIFIFYFLVADMFQHASIRPSDNDYTFSGSVSTIKFALIVM